MRVEIINTGSELLIGQVVNTHGAYFGQQLLELGLQPVRQTSIPDGDIIASTLRESITRGVDVLLVTGGLGPTPDDLTRELCAEMLGLQLEFDDSIMAAITARFAKFNRVPGENNRRQAMVPQGALVLENPNGTAPGLYFPPGLAEDSPAIFLLPGPPRELQPMFETCVLPRLREIIAQHGHIIPVCRNYWFFGIGESDLSAKVDAAIAKIPHLEVGYCLKNAGVIVRLTGPESAVALADAPLRACFPENLVSTDGETMEEIIVQLLTEKRQTVATAESCTGGFIAHHFTNVSGSSAIFGHGFVTYANEAKIRHLDVDPDTLQTHGAVSVPTVLQMAEGALQASGADHAIAVTGIAGPTGGSDEKPVGTVFIGLASRGQPAIAHKYVFQTDRITFKIRTVQTALDLLRRRLLDIPSG
jgi:nicotinamide-nucleotide amidase